MIRQRIHNPAQLTPEELKASFIARHETLARMLRILAEQKPGHPCQHVIVVGARGMGKTTLGLSFLQAVREDPEHSSNWQPVPFPEESYDIVDLADFWLAALHHLTEATGQEQWGARADELRQDEPDPERSAVYALAALLDFCQEEGQRLILFVENLELLFGQLRDEREVHALRAALMEHSEILLVGSANAVFDAIQSEGEPLYEFFRLVTLRGLDREECRELLRTLADRETGAAHPVSLDIEDGRLETIRQLTGGNPRLLVLACRMLLESPLGSAIDDLEQLIDEQTPYFKARIEALAPQARKVFHCLAQAWSPLLAREVANLAKLGSSHASSQLRQLIDKGYVREVRLPEETRGRYEVSDRFYNLYYLLRFSHAGRARLERLVDFLHQLFGPVGMRHTYNEALEVLRKGAFSPPDLSDWLAVFGRRVARDHEYREREDWLAGATALVRDASRGTASMADELARIVATERWGQTDMARVLETGIDQLLTGQAKKAEAAFRDVMATEPDVQPIAQGVLGKALYDQARFEDAVRAFESAATGCAGHEERWVQGLSGLATLGASFGLLRLEQTEAAISALECALLLAKPIDATAQCIHASVLCHLGDELVVRGRTDSAMHAWSRAAEVAELGDSVELRDLRSYALSRQIPLLLGQRRLQDVRALGKKAVEGIRLDDPPRLRHSGITSRVAMALASAHMKEPQDTLDTLDRLSEYVQPDDPESLRRDVAQGLATSSRAFGGLGYPETAEIAAREATKVDPTSADAWCALAEAVLSGPKKHLSEAERHARRAVDLAPDNSTLLTLYAVLKRRGKRKQAKELLARVPEASRIDAKQRHLHRWTQGMISMIADGHAAHVRELLAAGGLMESQEPLWHAARAELGEELGPLPAEVMDAVIEVRRQVAQERG